MAYLLVIGTGLVLVGLVLVVAASRRRRANYSQRGREAEREIHDIAAQTKAAIMTEFLRRTRERGPEPVRNRPVSTWVAAENSSVPRIVDAEIVGEDAPWEPRWPK